MSKNIIVTLILFLLNVPLSRAQTATVIDSLELKNVVITASKVPLSQRETTKPVIIIDRKQIELNQGKSFSQLMNRQSGIRINQAYGAPGENKSLFLQGAAGEQALILVDGLAIADPSGTGGAFDIRQFPLSNIERIEVIKGSQSTLYGTDAIAGVVNIITRTGSGKPFNANGQLSYGAYNTWKGNLGVNGEVSPALNYSITYSKETSDGFSAAKDPGGGDPFEDDGLDYDSFNGKITLKPVDAVTITPTLTYSVFEGDYDADAFNDAPNTFSLNLFNPGVQLAVENGNWNVQGGYNFTETQRIFSDEYGDNEFEGRLHNADVYATYKTGDFIQLLGGLNYQHSLLPGDDEISAQTVSPYATLLLKNLYGLNAELGYRLNNHSEYGQNSTLSFAPSYDLTDRIKIFTSIGTGFKVPTLDELFGPFGSNTDLTPQKSTYYSAGIEAYLLDNALKTGVHYFHRKIDDVIVYTGSGFMNQDRQNTNGVEVTGNWLVNTFLSFGLHYNYLSGEVITEDENGDRVTEGNLIRKPAHSLGGYADLQLNDEIMISIDGEYNEKRKDLFFNPETMAQEEVTLAPYTIINLHAEYEFSQLGITAFSDVRNLLDADFTEVYGFNTIGRSVTAGIRFSF